MDHKFLILMNEMQTILLTSAAGSVKLTSDDKKMMNLALKAIDLVGKLEDENRSFRDRIKQLEDRTS